MKGNLITYEIIDKSCSWRLISHASNHSYNAIKSPRAPPLPRRKTSVSQIHPATKYQAGPARTPQPNHLTIIQCNPVASTQLPTAGPNPKQTAGGPNAIPALKTGKSRNVVCDQKRSVVPVRERSAPTVSARLTLSVWVCEPQTPLSSGGRGR
jgi:hypothetical protein